MSALIATSYSAGSMTLHRATLMIARHLIGPMNEIAQTQCTC